MATITSTRAVATTPTYSEPGAVCCAYGVVELEASPSGDDIIEFCRIPRGAMVIGGWLRGDDLDDGTEALDIDIGWAANGQDDADPDGFGNLGTITGDPITDLKPETVIMYPFTGVLKDGPKTFAAETVIQGVVNTAADGTGTGTIWCLVKYITPYG